MSPPNVRDNSDMSRNSAMKPILVRGQPLAGGALPAICIPLVGRGDDALLQETSAAAAKRPDLLEWRVDFYEGIADPARVAALAPRLRDAAAGIPVLFTRRSPREGGQQCALREDQVPALYAAACASGAVDLLDAEMASDPQQLDALRETARRHGCGLLLSFHDFSRTPPLEDLLARFRQAAALGADIAKIAVMPQQVGDVLVLLQATLQASRELAIPVAGMSMGALGVPSRVCGGAFGSALTFAVGQAASAPGQVPIDTLRAALAALR